MNQELKYFGKNMDELSREELLQVVDRLEKGHIAMNDFNYEIEIKELKRRIEILEVVMVEKDKFIDDLMDVLKRPV